MSEVLVPKVGDKVRLVHENGDEAAFTVAGLCAYTEGDWSWLECATDTTFYKMDGWSVAEIVERSKPPTGTLIQGVDTTGYEFKGFVTLHGGINGVVRDGDDWVIASYRWNRVKSWEVVS